MNKDRNLLREIWNETQNNHDFNAAMPVELLERLHAAVSKPREKADRVMIGGHPHESRDKPPKLKCPNLLCRLNKDRCCAASEYIELLCSAKDFVADCKLKEEAKEISKVLRKTFNNF